MSGLKSGSSRSGAMESRNPYYAWLGDQDQVFRARWLAGLNHINDAMPPHQPGCEPGSYRQSSPGPTPSRLPVMGTAWLSTQGETDVRASQR